MGYMFGYMGYIFLQSTPPFETFCTLENYPQGPSYRGHEWPPLQRSSLAEAWA